MKLGDAVAAVLQPIVQEIDDTFATNLQTCSGCKRRQQKLNNLGDAIYDVFFQQAKEQDDAIQRSKNTTSRS